MKNSNEIFSTLIYNIIVHVPCYDKYTCNFVNAVQYDYLNYTPCKQ